MEKVKKSKTDYLVPIKPIYGKAMASKPVSVILPIELDEYVRSLPNRAEWLRETIAARIEQDRARQEVQDQAGSRP